MESIAQVRRGEGNVFFGEKGSECFGEAMEYQRKGKAFLACEGAAVFWIGWEGEIITKMSVAVVDGSY